MKRKMLVADLLCGAGGSSTGAQRALSELGLDMELVCVNHWPVAIDTHQRNHPEARHYVQDIATVRPHLLVPEGYLDLLMASPTCTHHSVARGGKPTSDQQRSDPWHIITWLTELRVKRIIIENVWEFCGWGPVDVRTGKPVASRKGEYFHAWIETIKRLGFEPEWRKLNAADYGDATTRQRFILMARSDGRKVHWPMPTHRKRDGAGTDLFDTAKPWRPAREIIDWQIKGKSIFNRKKPLAPKTLARIYAGALKFGWPEPFLVVLRQHMAGQSVDQPLPTIAANGNHIGLAEPVIVNMKGKSTASSSGEPLPTQTAQDPHLFSAEPVIMNGRKGNQAKAVSTDPVPTLDTKGGVWLAEPILLSQHNSGAPRSANDPLPTITTGGAATEQRPGCARPMLIEPFLMSRHAEGAPRTVDEPTPTQVAKHSHLLISPYYGSGSGETCTSGEDPLPTATAKARFGMVVPITHSDGSNRARNVDADPLPTLTTANRGELAFITAQHGERDGQAPRVHDIDNPTPTIAATGHVDLVQATPEFDILFRMLEPHELAAAMGLNTDEAEYEFAGTKTEKIKQIGNAVSVAKMKACVKAIMADAALKRAANDNKEANVAAA
ncbi:DNA cytosine methyltransferase [Mesorhizobium sp. M00.F.Ca.ET.217.01.1.1]|uniref:DNA cytosine methyltransferase n=1 Tax=Mesorhizobium sp. M00.F.Ca.ET.217.01.1.1 TaxID=2500529 RepID=UPI000FDB72B8|nr:DNA cytosine methyltransferase [Mesorhizobium sp. M00.F.Ca.ET.217.01.1.1]TGQ19305.1 DNA cytosine methyltransferase [Mesorhizobium sp. M00.F.Ca.ET.217.01.1.1]